MKLQTKQDFQELLMDIINPLKNFVNKDKTGYKLGTHATWYDDGAAVCESFSRPLWGLVPYFAGGGRNEFFEKLCIEGMKNGTDRSKDCYWGDCADRDQRFVEMAAFAYGMLLCPQTVWEPLGDEGKKNLSDWLWQINTHEVCDSNWKFFRILVNIALKKNGLKYSAEKLEEDLRKIDEFYIGDGWYRDGVKGQKDYYIPFAFHFYSLIYARFMEEDDFARCKLYKDRACEFAQTFIYWFAEDGEAIPYGRSLTYRFAQIAFWSACVFAGIRPFEVGVMKGIIVRNFEKWFESDMFDNAHILSVGYKYGNLLMAEHYNAYGSPYWSLKAFAFLALADDDEFFKAEALPLPRLDRLKKIEAADMVISRECGNTAAYVAGTHNEFGCGQIIAKYLKFVYSTKFGFCVPYSNVNLEELAPDSMLVFELNGVYFMRNGNDGFALKENGLITEWSAFGDIKVTTDITITPEGHKRKHTIKTPYALKAYDCGYAVKATEGLSVSTDENGAEVKNEFSRCAIKGGRGKIINASANTNIMYNRAVIPCVCFEIPKGEYTIETEITEG